MIAIHNRRPTMMTLPLLLDAYIEHQKEVVHEDVHNLIYKKRKIVYIL